MSEIISPHIVFFFFIVSHGVGTRRAPEQVGARSRASEEDVGVVRRASQGYLGFKAWKYMLSAIHRITRQCLLNGHLSDVLVI